MKVESFYATESGPKVIKLYYRQVKKFVALSLSDIVFIMLINVKMPTIFCISTFISRINIVLS